MKYTLKKYLIILIIILITSLLLFSFPGCKGTKEQAKGSAEESQQAEGESNSTGSSKEDSQEEDTAGNKTTNTEGSPQTSKDTQKTDSSSESSSPGSTEEEQEQIPQEITDLIEAADDYYSAKEYGLAKNTYRKAEIAINDSSLSEDKKQDLKNSFNSKYEESKKIIETAMNHYANAKQLEYEQQYKAALEELEAALAIYPNYKEALEEYENLKTQLGLQ